MRGDGGDGEGFGQEFADTEIAHFRHTLAVNRTADHHERQETVRRILTAPHPAQQHGAIGRGHDQVAEDQIDRRLARQSAARPGHEEVDGFLPVACGVHLTHIQRPQDAEQQFADNVAVFHQQDRQAVETIAHRGEETPGSG